MSISDKLSDLFCSNDKYDTYNMETEMPYSKKIRRGWGLGQYESSSLEALAKKVAMNSSKTFGEAKVAILDCMADMIAADEK